MQKETCKENEIHQLISFGACTFPELPVPAMVQAIQKSAVCLWTAGHFQHQLIKIS